MENRKKTTSRYVTENNGVDWVRAVNEASLKTKLIWGFSGSVILASLLSMAVVVGKMRPDRFHDDPNVMKCPDDAVAFAQSLQFVRNRIAPRQANFDRSTYTANRTSSDSCDWYVSGRFDTVNAFNAPTRGYWSINMRHDDGNWYGTSLRVY
ncbi:hypothetical protein [Halochromatium salexigens]|uniref:hypothetical protein n=1 Tax=Halochromatium salexigens TaxID=49447 RepID=UPI001912821C|nr:hypothetical protein [Halochromatium salexigens]